jgi:hypothetical protein
MYWHFDGTQDERFEEGEKEESEFFKSKQLFSNQGNNFFSTQVGEK